MKAALSSLWSRRLFWAKLGLVSVVALGSVFFLQAKKEALVRLCQDTVTALFRRQTDLNVTVGRVSGHFLGTAVLHDLRVEAPWLPEERRLLFQAKSIEVRYRFLDFLSKKFDSKIVVTVDRPLIVWTPRLKVRRQSFPFMDWMREWTLSGLQNLQVEVRDLQVQLEDGHRLRGIQASLSREALHFQAPLTHLAIGRLDVTSTIHVRGGFEPGNESRPDALRGELTTEGTVINWKPVEDETRFDLVLTSDELRMTASDFLGGIQVLARLNLSGDSALDATVTAKGYPFSNLEPFISGPQSFRMPTKLDLEAEFSGTWLQSQVNFRARIYEGWIGKATFEALDVNGSGVYPTVRLSDSKILMQDGVTTMRFADRAVEIKDLFRSQTFEALVSEAQQERVVWSGWELSRTVDDNDLSEFMMQRLFGDNASVHFRKYNEDPEKPVDMGEVDPTPLEFGFEYKLRSKDSVKVEVRDGEEFVGVEHKVIF